MGPRMSVQFRRNKSELIVLTGAIYSFVAYLTAFTLEILFLVDLTRRANEILSAGSASSDTTNNPEQLQPASPPISSQVQSGGTAPTPQQISAQASFERLTFEAMQAHITVSCLAISILYFVIFITSLILVVALILRSTFMLLIWMCAMTTMYLPEFGLVTYVSIYSWGLETRNGQVELGFYLLRAGLNLIFILRAHKLFKQWSYEKNFFRLGKTSSGLTSGASSAAASHRFGPMGYDSPFFIGDSLTTTINPVFTGSTLNLNRYDYVRGDHFLNHQPPVNSQNQYQAGGSLSRNTSPTTTTNQSVFSNSTELNDSSQSSSMAGGRGRLGLASMYSRELAKKQQQQQQPLKIMKPSRFYLGDPGTPTPPTQTAMHRHTSMLSINDADLDADYEMDLDYRTLNRRQAGEQDHQARHHHNRGQNNQQRRRHEPPANYNQQAATSRSQENLDYSTQSLDRRRMRDFTEQVVLRPLGHQPFEYLQRPGSTSNLHAGVSLNTGGGGATPADNTQQQQRHRDYNLHYRYGN